MKKDIGPLSEGNTTLAFLVDVDVLLVCYFLEAIEPILVLSCAMGAR
jgi:hypothetical protein